MRLFPTTSALQNSPFSKRGVDPHDVVCPSNSSRPREGFPCSVALVGLRDVRDYKVAAGGSDRLRTSSPFNIKVESLTMCDFTRAEIAELYGQHTAAIGQVFDPASIDRAYALTHGQPWLVNALARQVVGAVVRDPCQAISAADIDRARDILVDRQETHLDSLAERLREPRVRALIEPMILGESLSTMPPDDLRFVLDLGLLRRSPDGMIEIANPIYREIIARELTVIVRASLPKLTPTWLDAAGELDADKLRDAFISFWLQHGEALLASSPYNEAAAHLVLMAYLHRVVHGGGRIDREFAIGSKRLDLCVEYRGNSLGIEVKTWRDTDHARDPSVEGLVQLDGYLARIGLTHGWLIVFDQRKGVPPLPERQALKRATTAGGRTVEVLWL